jgi:CHAD domain-containing protein
VHQALLQIIIRNEPGVRAALDSEFLHDYRVAIRRTRSLLRQIRNVFPDDAVEHFSSEFSWIGRLTGPSRDMDVLVLALCQRRLDMAADDVAAVISCVQMAQQDEHRKLVERWTAIATGSCSPSGRRS